VGSFIVLFCSSFLFRTVLAQPLIGVESIQRKALITVAHPLINYFGRDPKIESERENVGGGIPSPPYADVGIYGRVIDPYGKLMHAVLSYAIQPGDLIEKRHSFIVPRWSNITMTLINGIPSNGTYEGVIPAQRDNTTVFYRAYFKDDLNYTSMLSNSYYVGDHKLLDILEFPSAGREIGISARLVDYDRDIRNVTLHYAVTKYMSSVNCEQEEAPEVCIIPPKNFTVVKMIPVFGTLSCFRCERQIEIQTYKAKIPMGKSDSLVWSFVNSSDSKGNTDSSKPISMSIFKKDIADLYKDLNSVIFHTTISSVDVDSRLVKTEIEGQGTVNSSLFNNDTSRLLAEALIGDHPAAIIGVPGVNLAGNVVQGHFVVRFNGEDKETGTSELSVGNDTSDFQTLFVPLMGDPSSFPFDHYFVNLLLFFPAENLRFPTEVFSDKAVNASWILSYVTSSFNANEAIKRYSSINNCNITGLVLLGFCSPNAIISDPSTLPDAKDRLSHSTILNVHLDFKRNYTIAIITLPVLAIFYLLGAVFILKNSNIGNRLALTVGIFALIFTLSQIITSMKPTTSGPTVADSLLSAIVFATIAYTVSSVISCNAAVQRKFPRHYAWADAFVFILVSTVVIVILSGYNPELTSWLIPVILVGLGYGLLLRISKTSLVCKRNPNRLRSTVSRSPGEK
jgi:hypothetical protein